ncbi:MAG: alpha-1,4-glucan--maltose-1-phosphate maltosyltransferase [Burkholderiaceae bacterium]
MADEDAANVQPIGLGDGRIRAVVENVAPQVDDGRFAVKRTVGDTLVVEADCFADGHDAVACALLWRRDGSAQWQVAPMAHVGNDRWRGSVHLDAIGRYRYTVCAWVDHFLSWRHDLARRVDRDDVRLALRIGAQLVAGAAGRAGDATERDRLQRWAEALERAAASVNDVEALKRVALDPALAAAAARHPDLQFAYRYPRELPLVVERERARFSAWYELFPRSAASEPGRHGTFADCEKLLPYVAQMGFDVLYLPPIHPIGRLQRKGRNNALVAGADDVGSPWAIGSDEGGHTAVHPQLGTLEDFRRLVARAHEHGLEVALDIAFQCAPDHPWVREHPEWFRRRPDGSVQYAENPPKKYQDIYPFDFESAHWRELWLALARVFEFWIEQGVKIFRVDNPHTKAFAFWEWAIDRLQTKHPDLIVLSEAFTRPKVMHRLAKLGFTQSYTYFAWRNTKRELTEYFTELAHGPGREYFRPNVWPNTPDILTEALQFGTRGTFMARVALAATLAASYGIYGPAYELIEQTPREPGSEEYLDSEKYQLRHWNRERPDSLAPFIAALNRIRRANPALQRDDSLRFLSIDNEQMIAYAKSTPDLANVIVCAVNLDPHHVQSGWLTLDLAAFGLTDEAPYQMHDLVTGARYLWHGARNFVSLDPQRSPVHVFRLQRRVHREHDFDYFM